MPPVTLMRRAIAHWSRLACGYRVSIRGSIPFLVLGVWMLVSGCRNTEQTWSLEVRSPDGRYIVSARTLEPGGWGTGSPPQTTVDLNWTHGSQSPAEIFAFVDGPDQPGGMSVGIHWLTSTHLELVYKGHPTIDFQAVKCRGVDIGARGQ
jgi:hypothetical protein